jgi:hypothetical protein
MRILTATGLGIALMALAGGNAGAADNARVWEGFLQITARTAQCSGQPGTTGTHVSIYRPKIGGGVTMLSIVYVRAAITIQNLSESGTPQMNGAGNYRGLVIGNKARFYKYSSTYNFPISPGTVLANTQIVTISGGTINNVFNKAGCTITFDAKYHKRD